jgi:hypothetical protein
VADEQGDPISDADSVPDNKSIVRTAVVIVHGMGEQLPVETLNKFVKTALPPPTGKKDRHYFSRPERVTDSYEARRHLATRQPPKPAMPGPLEYGQTEFFEYHWSYLMTGNKLGDIAPTVLRLFLRFPWKVPYGLRTVWVIGWLLFIGLAILLVYVVRTKAPEEWTWEGILVVILGQGVLVTVLLQVLNRAGAAVTKSFVDVVRYLDRSPRSYEVRRDIRKGMVDLLQGIHDKGRYSRVVIVAHSLGAYIAYDGISALWPEMCNLHAGPYAGPPADGKFARLEHLKNLEAAAVRVSSHDPKAKLTATQPEEVQEFRDLQFALWRDNRSQGNPWLVTDFISVGTPMYFADLLYTRNRKQFDALTKVAELPRCPPSSGNQTVEGRTLPVGDYGFPRDRRERLVHGSPFAVVRWTNLYFPAVWTFFGDWFGGPLRPLFGSGIVDRPITGNRPWRFLPALAHSRYFSYPDRLGTDDVATVLRGYLGLDLDEDLIRASSFPKADPATDTTA